MTDKYKLYKYTGSVWCGSYSKKFCNNSIHTLRADMKRYIKPLIKDRGRQESVGYVINGFTADRRFYAGIVEQADWECKWVIKPVIKADKQDDIFAIFDEFDL